MGLLTLAILTLVSVVQGTFQLTTLFNIIGWTQTINWTATVHPAPNPLGSVVFTDNGNTIKTVALKKDGLKAVALLQYTVSTGPAEGAKTSVAHSIGATAGSQHLNRPFSVVQGMTKLVLSTNKAQYQLGTKITATATVTKTKGTLAFTPHSVNWQLDDVAITCDTTDTTSPFVCKFTATGDIGERELLAYYPGDATQFYGGSFAKAFLTFVCPTGSADCDGDLVCETDTTSDSENCGQCEQSCDLANTITTCANSNCTTTGCQLGFGDCVTSTPGCETNTNTSNAHCGLCDTPCTLPHAAANCVSGTCEVTQCNAGFLDCPSANSPGCETNKNTVTNCGNCGNICSTQNGAPSCPAGTCEITCNQGFADCDGTLGCEFTCDAFPVTTSFNSSVTEYPSSLSCPSAVANLSLAELPRRATGVSNGDFVVATRSGVEIGIRAEERTVGNIAPVGQALYETIACQSARTTTQDTNAGTQKARWNYAVSVDLRAGTGPYEGATFDDFNITLVFSTLAFSNSYQKFPYTLDVKSLGVNLINDVCTSCGLPQSGTNFAFGDQFINYQNCSDLANKGVPFLTFLQESSNIRFQLADFPYTQPGIFQVTLSLIPKTICDCPLSVTMLVVVEQVTCPND